MGKLRRELSRISKRKSDLYEDYSERLITEEEYIQFSRIYSNEIENIKSRLDTVLAAQVRYSQDYHIEEGWGNVIHTYMSKRKLTKEWQMPLWIQLLSMVSMIMRSSWYMTISLQIYRN